MYLQTIVAIPRDKEAFCLLAMHRADCDGMTFREGQCHLHKNTSDFQLVTCNKKSSFYRYVIK